MYNYTKDLYTFHDNSSKSIFIFFQKNIKKHWFTVSSGIAVEYGISKVIEPDFKNLQQM